MNIGYHRDASPGEYGAVILAAGLSSRMHDFKPLLPVDGRPAITGLIEMLHSAGIEDIVAVTGHQREQLQEVLRLARVEEVYNDRFAEGMFTSIQAGLTGACARFPEKKGYFLIPVDCPLITIGTVLALCAAANGTSGDIADREDRMDCFFVPTYEGKKGHPLLIPRSRADQIITYDGEGGLKAITDAYWEQMVRVPVPDEECVMDMDTPEGYAEITHFVEKGFKRDKLSVLSARKRIFLVRHGETQQHAEPMFIGQYDVPLSEEGIRQAQVMAEEISGAIASDVAAQTGWIEGVSLGKEPLPAIETVFTSDLSRAKETAEIIADRICRDYRRDRIFADVQELAGLREINLGEWDGRPIREMKEQAPEDYARRGEDVFTFKKGNGAENFYDMQYRAVKALRDILHDDYARNVVIVAHSGVIRALENNLKGLRVDDDWTPLDKGTYTVWEG